MLETALILGFVTAERLVELAIARRNTARLLAEGAEEAGAAHYPLIVALHAAWLGGLWLLAWGRPIGLGVLALFGLLQLARLWVLVTLGRRWTTRIVVRPGETLVRRGPYRLLRHPNYLVVALEIPTLPLVFGLGAYALAFGLLNLAMLAWRIRVEDRALSRAASAATSRP